MPRWLLTSAITESCRGPLVCTPPFMGEAVSGGKLVQVERTCKSSSGFQPPRRHQGVSRSPVSCPQDPVLQQGTEDDDTGGGCGAFRVLTKDGFLAGDTSAESGKRMRADQEKWGQRVSVRSPESPVLQPCRAAPAVPRSSSVIGT